MDNSVDFVHPNPKTFDSYQLQNFPFPRDLISHITTNPCSTKEWENLQKTCKYFFAKNKIVIVNETVNQKYKVFYCFINFDDEGNSRIDGPPIYFVFKKIGNIKFWPNWRLSFLNDFKQFPINVFQNIYRWNLVILTCENYNFTEKEINFLMDSETIIELKLINVNILNEDGEWITMDQIFSKLPNIQIFDYRNKNEIFTTKTFGNLNALKFKSKFSECTITIDNLAFNSDISLLCNFIKNTSLAGENSSRFEFSFGKNAARRFQEELKCIISEMLNNWEGKDDQKPIVEIVKAPSNLF